MEQVAGKFRVLERLGFAARGFHIAHLLHPIMWLLIRSSQEIYAEGVMSQSPGLGRKKRNPTQGRK